MHSSVGGQVRAVLGGKGANFALVLALVRVDGLVLGQGVSLAKGLAAGVAGELLLSVFLLMFPQIVYRFGAEFTTRFFTLEGLTVGVTRLVGDYLQIRIRITCNHS